MAIHDQPNASPGRRVPRSHRRGRHQLLEGREGRRLDRNLVGHVAPARGDSCRPPGKPGTIPNRERGTLSPAPFPSKAPRRLPLCRLQVAARRRKDLLAWIEALEWIWIYAVQSKTSWTLASSTLTRCRGPNGPFRV